MLKFLMEEFLDVLSLTRIFGDSDFKEFGINCGPFIKKWSINKYNIKYIVIASDGIWNIVDHKQLLIIEKGLKIGNSEEFCNNLVKYSINGGFNDNISCIALKFGEKINFFLSYYFKNN